MESYPWYDVVEPDEPLAQGDFADRCPIVIPPDTVEAGTTVTADVETYNVVIMSQSCDLAHAKIDLVLVCPVFPLSKMRQRHNHLQSTKGLNDLTRGNLPGYHILNRCQTQGFERDHQVVDFHNVYGIHFQTLVGFVQQAGARLRLLPPYREHLSQAFARFFMRVGLPVDTDPFE